MSTTDHVYQLEYTDNDKYIGIIIDSKLEYIKHMCFKIKKANSNSIMAVIHRSFTMLNESNVVSLYKALVRSHLVLGAIQVLRNAYFRTT